MSGEGSTRERGRGHPDRDAPAGAFALIELVVVGGLILVLYVMLYAPGSKARQARMKALCAANLRNIHIALQTYAGDWREAFPAATNAAGSEVPLSLLIPRYTTGSQFFICPGSGDRALPDAKPFSNRRISYAYYMGRALRGGAGAPLMSDRQVNTASKRVGEPLFSLDGKRPGNNHRQFGGNVMFCDGSVRASPARAAFDLPVAAPVVLLNPGH